ncbi:cytochrome P450 [Streptomyces sp. UH6]|uniref:cytochrome P450 family protein n=1 Tax=Streptomyces sp. UH6 TaxID=2748379 RepID=UPI00211E31C4|nr:cytochrome P450 [Streptomyces sp. UH6]
MSASTAVLPLDPTGRRHHKEIRLLHARGPATLVDVLGVTAWSISDPHLLKQLLVSQDVSKDARAHWPDFDAVAPTWPLALWVSVHNMFTAYGGDHRRLRRMISPAFSARPIGTLAPTVEAIVTHLLDDIANAGDEVVDLREKLAYPLPITVIAQLMGVPVDQRTAFRQVVDGVFTTTLSSDEATANTAVLYQLLDELIARKRLNPADDMTSFLIAARDEEGDDRGLTDDELRDTLLLMISAGYETTVNVIDQAITTLLTHPDQLAHVREGRAGWNDVVEETLRFEPAVKHLPLRYAVNDVPLPDGQVIPKGAPILASYAAANRHPSLPNPDDFDLTRADKDHLAFGHGVHFCLGAPLARIEVATALKQLFEQFPDMTLAVPADQLRPVPSLISNGHERLLVRLHGTR